MYLFIRTSEVGEKKVSESDDARREDFLARSIQENGYSRDRRR